VRTFVPHTFYYVPLVIAFTGVEQSFDHFGGTCPHLPPTIARQTYYTLFFGKISSTFQIITT